MKTEYMTWKCADCNKPKLRDFLYCEKHLKAEYERWDKNEEEFRKSKKQVKGK